MTVLVDDARWEWRGDRWAHLVSDVSYDELHEFARRLGKRRLGFQGDHYDVSSIDRERAVVLGAEPVDSRSLVHRLRRAGLRDRTAKPQWAEWRRWGPGSPSAGLETFGGPGRRLGEAVDSYGPIAVSSELVVLFDSQFLVALIELRAGVLAPNRDVDVDRLVVGEPRADETSSIELFVRR